jgi:hypothetical protein
MSTRRRQLFCVTAAGLALASAAYPLDGATSPPPEVPAFPAEFRILMGVDARSLFGKR